MKKVKSFLAKDCPTVGRATPLREMMKTFAETEQSMVAVVENDGKLVGIVLLEDILENLLLSHEEALLLEKLHFLADFFSSAFEDIECISPLIVAGDIMRPAATVREDDSILKAAILMKKKNEGRLVVVDSQQRVVGYITRNGICRALVS